MWWLLAGQRRRLHARIMTKRLPPMAVAHVGRPVALSGFARLLLQLRNKQPALQLVKPAARQPQTESAT